MKKFLKIGGGIAKWYVITTVGVYTIHGVADFCKRLSSFDGEDGCVLNNVSEYVFNMLCDDLKSIKENIFGTFYYKKLF